MYLFTSCEREIYIIRITIPNGTFTIDSSFAIHSKYPEDGSPINTDPPSYEEIAEYGKWLGLTTEDSDLIWIAKQALQTHIPTPWFECETEDGDIFYFNAKTKESVWDHPYDLYYKAAIAKFKSGACNREELIGMVSQEWLLSGADKRASSKEIPGMPGSSVNDSPTRATYDSSSSVAGTKSFRLVGVATGQDESPKLVVSLTSSVDADNASPTSSLMFVPSGGMSPGRSRRRASRTSPKNSIIRQSGDSHNELQEKMIELTMELESSRKRQKAETTALKADLIKARDYIELLLVENKGLRSRMADAASRVELIQKDAAAVKTQLVKEMSKREAAESQARYLENRVRALETDSPSAKKSGHILSRLCGGNPPVEGGVSKRSSARITADEARKITKSAPTTPGEDPYKELITLLASAPTTPASSSKINK
jgi:hypothetical protein